MGRLAFVLAALLAVTVSAQRGERQAQPPAPKEVAAPAIPGVVAPRTQIELVKFPVANPEGPIGLPDGSGIIFTERGSADRITKIDANGTLSTFVEKGNL